MAAGCLYICTRLTRCWTLEWPSARALTATTASALRTPAGRGPPICPRLTRASKGWPASSPAWIRRAAPRAAARGSPRLARDGVPPCGFPSGATAAPSRSTSSRPTQCCRNSPRRASKFASGPRPGVAAHTSPKESCRRTASAARRRRPT